MSETLSFGGAGDAIIRRGKLLGKERGASFGGLRQPMLMDVRRARLEQDVPSIGKGHAMDRREFLGFTLLGLGTLAAGCRGKQFARVAQPGQPDMVASHQAGAETFKPLTEEAVAKLLGRHCSPFQQASYVAGQEQLPTPPMRICFVCVENKSAEEIGDFKEQLYQIIDTKILESRLFQPISKRYVDAALRETRLRPDSLYIPENRRMFTAFLEQQGQPFDYLLYATVTSGTTRENHEFQRDYLLTLEMVNVNNGHADKESATLTKTYHKSRIGRMMQAWQ